MEECSLGPENSDIDVKQFSSEATGQGRNIFEVFKVKEKARCWSQANGDGMIVKDRKVWKESQGLEEEDTRRCGEENAVNGLALLLIDQLLSFRSQNSESPGTSISNVTMHEGK